MAKLFHTSEVDEYDFLNKTAMKNLSIHLMKLSNAVWDNKEITNEFIDSIIDKRRTAVNIDKIYVQRLYKEELPFDDYKIDDDIIFSFIDDIIQMPLVQRKINTYIKSAKYEYNTEQDPYEDGLKDVNVLLDNNDKIGDDYELSKKFDVDVCTRDKPFVYLNGEMVYGDPGSIHSTILNKILDDPSSIGYRPRDAAGIPSLDVNTPIAFGHIYKDLAFIETYDNCSIDDIVNTLTGINKVYDYNVERHLLKRVAKLNKIANIQGLFGSDKITKHNGMAETFMFDLSGGDKAFINIYHDALDDLLYTELQVEDKNGYIIDNQVLVTNQDHDKGITSYSDIKYQLEQRHKD